MDRTVKVRLEAIIGPYQAQMAKASAVTKQVGSDLQKFSVDNERQFRQLGIAAGIGGAAIAVGLGKAVGASMSFDKAMSGVQAATHASAKAMGSLRDAALDAGARTAFSATESAAAIEELAKAGISTADILGGALDGALDLAAAGEMEVATAAETAASAMTMFKLSGTDMAHVADLLAAGAGKAQGSVGDLSAALGQSGLVASQVGLSIEETTAGLAAFASAGLVGSDAGTSFKAMLQRLTPQSSEAANLMDELGFSAFDAQGNFIGLEGVAGELQTALAGMTVEQRNATMGTLFGSDAIRAAAVLYEQGAEGVATWTSKVDDAGYAAETAAIRLDNLAGDLEAFGGSIETALIGSGSNANGVLRFMAQNATEAVNAFSGLPGPVQAAGFGLASTAAAGLGVVGMAGMLLPKVRETRTALTNMGAAGIGANKALGWMGRTAGYGLGLVALIEAASVLEDKLMKVAMTEADVTGMGRALYQLAEDGRVTGEMARQFGSDLEGLGDSIAAVTDRGLGDKLFGESVFGRGNLDAAVDEVNALDEALAGMVRSGNADEAARVYQQVVDAMAEQGIAAPRVEDALNGYHDALEESALQADAAAAGSDDFAGGLTGVQEAAAEAEQALDDFLDLVDQYIGTVFGFQDAQQAFTLSLLDARDHFKELEGAERKAAMALDQNTRAGIEAQNQLQEIASASADVVKAMAEEGKSAGEMAYVRGLLAQKAYDEAIAMGFGADKAGELRDQIMKIPTQPIVPTVNTSSLDGALAKVSALQASLNRIGTFRGGPTVTPSVSQVQDVARYEQQRRAGFGGQRAAGGPVDPGRFYLVGEEGPELAMFGQAGTVLPNRHPATQQALRSPGFPGFAGGLNLGMFPGGSLGDKPDSAWDVTQFARSVGGISDKDWERSLRERLSTFRRFSTEWQEAYRELVDFQEEKAEEERRTAEDLKKFLEAHYEARQREAEEARKAAEDAAADARRFADDRLSDLNSLLDDEQRIRRQQQELAEQHRKRMAEIQASFVTDQQSVIDDRRKQLADSLNIEERFVVGWANSLGALTRNTQQQVGVFAEWQEELASVRERGVSQAVVDLLGLDEGPQSLAQLRMFASATEQEIADLNAAVAAKNAQATDTAQAEAQQSYSEVGRMLYDLAEKHAAEVEKLTEEFLADQRELSEELASLGLDQGRSYGTAIEAGIRSSIPGIQAAAQAARDAMAGLQEAQQSSVTVQAGTQVRGPDGTMHPIENLASLFGSPQVAGGGWSVPIGSLMPAQQAPVVNVSVQVGNEPVDARVRQTISGMNTSYAIAGSH